MWALILCLLCQIIASVHENRIFENEMTNYYKIAMKIDSFTATSFTKSYILTLFNIWEFLGLLWVWLDDGLTGSSDLYK